MGLASAIVRAAARAFPMPTARLWQAIYPHVGRMSRYAGDEYESRQAAFATIYDENRWGSEESRSGSGSTLANTAPLRAALPDLLRRRGVRVMLDAPCGDFHWMQRVDLRGVSYIGGDIVSALICEASQRYTAPGRRFRHLDIVCDPLPRADLWLCRDVLIHLSNAEVLAVLRQAAASEIGYFLSSTYGFARENLDIRPGGWRFINLQAAPFNLPPPLETVRDFVAPEPPRVLGLWSRAQICAAVGRWDEAA